MWVASGLGQPRHINVVGFFKRVRKQFLDLVLGRTSHKNHFLRPQGLYLDVLLVLRGLQDVLAGEVDDSGGDITRLLLAKEARTF